MTLNNGLGMNANSFSPGFAERIEIAGTITKLPLQARGKVVISGSHGGELPGGLAMRAGARAVILNDAGVGFEEAGIGSLALCQKFGMAAAVVDHDSCRIGDADDMVDHGIISHANAVALAQGVEVGQACREAAEHLTAAPQPPDQNLPEFSENREVLEEAGRQRKLVLVDSASMILPEDEGQVVVTGSHGGLIGNNPNAAIKAPVFAAFFNDAGVGMDNWGISRLPVLDQRGIAGVTLDCLSCRIGDARSAYERGIVSYANARANALGIEIGMTAKQVAHRLCD